VKEECLDRMIFFGTMSLRRALTEFTQHYNDVSYCLIKSSCCGEET